MKARIETKAEFTIHFAVTIQEAKQLAIIAAFAPKDFIETYKKLSPSLAKDLEKTDLDSLFQRLREVDAEVKKIYESLRQFVNTPA